MTNLTCFWHPKLGHFDLSLEDICDQCTRSMRHPLDHPPISNVRNFQVREAIDRGYYSATYVAEQGQLGQRVCLKIIPKLLYELREKNFFEECRQHSSVAQGTQHLVMIRDAFDADVMFEGELEPLPCHVAVLDYVEGQSLRSVLDRTDISAITTAQIAVDLLRLLQELENKQVFHNDLHSGNILIQSLSSEMERGDAIDPFTRAVAVDLGSVLDSSRSDEKQQIADSHQVTAHLMRLALQVMPDPMTAPDLEFRLALALNDIAGLLRPENLAQRSPNYPDLIASIRSAFVAAASPWKKPSDGLVRFGDSFNAQTMRPWFVPRLLVDPGGDWQRRIESAGPLVITGMRGCGKTMLLRALQFHARAGLAGDDEGRSGDEVVELLRQDGYVGLYVSCNRLLDGLGKPEGPLHEPNTRLFLCYAREALHALRHLSEVAGREAVSPVAPRPIASLLASQIKGSLADESDNTHVLERKILDMLRSLESGHSIYTLGSHLGIAMPNLATAIMECASAWSDSRVLFLLDDVSTRHLNEESIRRLLSSLMFTSENCAFKITTEAQTLELVLKSPGFVETARSGRDYDTFDLASAIYTKLRDTQGRGGRDFIAEVLQQRARLTPTHPNWSPRDIMGDQSLVSIARAIASSTDSSPDRKNVYSGMSALAAVCVGDIGDVISIYELILQKAGTIKVVPVASRHQSGAFQEFCSRRLYQLSRRQGRLKHFADGFAKAAHELLIQSARRDSSRLRDYASVYVRVTTGDADAQLLQLRELMDAGVFVLTSGPDTPRTKTRDSDPIAQFTLTFRKLLGLASAIGLSQRDRFELSGDSLVEWLNHPEESAELLMRNLASSPSHEAEDEREEYPSASTKPQDQRAAAAPTLFDDLEDDEPGPLQPVVDPGDWPSVDSELRPALRSAVRLPSIREIGIEQLQEFRPHTLITARGFEDRTLVSTQRLLDAFTPDQTLMLTYPLDGRGPEVAELLNRSETTVTTLESEGAFRLLPAPRNGLGLVDTTGLSKASIYRSIRELLNRDGRALVMYTEADRYYPLNEDVVTRLTSASDDDYARLQACSDILTGEKRPYHFVGLHHSDVDDGRRRVLLAFGAAKHERLFSLLEERDYDHVEIVVPSKDTPRAELARLAARVAVRDFHSCEIRQLPSGDLDAVLHVARDCFEDFYALANFNFEVGMTGSKLDAIALAAASTTLKFSQVWYVKPDGYDISRFTTGAGASHLFFIERSFDDDTIGNSGS